MANLGGTYTAGDETMNDTSALPDGDYIAAIAKSEKRDSKSGTGAYINLEFEVMDGPAKGRRFWTMLNLWNDNATAVEIAQRELNSILHACGKLRISDTEEIHGIPMLVRLGTKKDEGYGAKNVVKSYKPVNGAPVHQAAGAAGGAAAGGAKAGPWA